MEKETSAEVPESVDVQEQPARKRKRDSAKKSKRKTRPTHDDGVSSAKSKKKRRSKNADEEENEEDVGKLRIQDESDEDMDGIPGTAELVKNIEINAAKTNLTTKNVKSILHHLFSDKRLLDLVKSVAGDTACENESTDGNDFGHRVTRSRFKKNKAEAPSKFEFSVAEFAEDEEDAEYDPENDSLVAASDDDSVSTTYSDQPSPSLSDTNDTMNQNVQSVESVNTDRDADAEKPGFVTHKDGTVFRMPGMPLSETKKTSIEQGGEIIASRTRSKISLKDLSLETLEASFEPPDVDPEMYDITTLDEMDPDDIEWQNWLSKLISNDEVEDSIDENDDDFNFMAVDETLDEEEFWNDKREKISHKELQDLFDEVLNDFDGLMQDETSILSCVLPRLPVITWPQRLTLTAQLQQHTQLLTQSYMLTCKDPLLKKETENSKEYMQELANFREAMTNDPAIGRGSVYCFPGLDYALGILDSVDHPFDFEAVMLNMDPAYRLKCPPSKIRKSCSTPPMPLRIGLRIFLDPYFATYRELIPTQGPIPTERLNQLAMEPTRLKFFKSEDNLLALGLSQFGFDYDLISQYMLPTKTPKQLKTRTKNLSAKRESENAVKKYKRDKILPPLHSKICIIQPRGVSSKSIKQLYYEISQETRLPPWMEKMNGHIKQIEDECRKFVEYSSGHSYRPLAVKPTPVTQNSLSLTASGDMYQILAGSQKPSLNEQGERATQDHKPMEIRHENIRLPEQKETIINQPLFQTSVQGEYLKDDICTNKASVEVVTTTANSSVDQPASDGLDDSCVPVENTSQDSPISLPEIPPVDEDEATEEEPPLHPLSPDDVEINNENNPNNINALSDESGNFSCDDDIVEQDDDSATEERATPDNNTDANNDSAVEDEIAEHNSSPAEVMDYKEIEDIENEDLKSKESSKQKSSVRSCSHNRRKNKVTNPKFNWDEKLQEKAAKFADLYFERVKETLVNHQDLYSDFLHTINEAACNGTPKVQIYKQLLGLLKEYPDLVEMFVGFLEPGDAREVGKFKTWLEFDRARNFLLSCEANFRKTKYYHQLLRKIVKLNETEKDSKKIVERIAPLFRGNQHLVAEFNTFFPDLPPPPCRGDDFEVIQYRPEAGGFDYIDNFEEVQLTFNEGDSEDPLERRSTILDNLAAWLQKPALNCGDCKSDKNECKRTEGDCDERFKERPSGRENFANFYDVETDEDLGLIDEAYLNEDKGRIDAETHIDRLSDIPDSGTNIDAAFIDRNVEITLGDTPKYDKRGANIEDSTRGRELSNSKLTQANTSIRKDMISNNTKELRHGPKCSNTHTKTPSRVFSAERLSKIDLDKSPSGTKLNRIRIDVNSLEQGEGFHKISPVSRRNASDINTTSAIPLVEILSSDSATEAEQSCDDEGDSDSEASSVGGVEHEDATDLHWNNSGHSALPWNREDDRSILMTCQQKGPSESTFEFIASQLTKRTKVEVVRQGHEFFFYFAPEPVVGRKIPEALLRFLTNDYVQNFSII